MKRFSIVTAKLAGFGKNLLPIYGSSALAAWAYDSTTEVFEVVFHSGVVKRYHVPIPTVQGFMAAKSKGGFYNREIKFRKLIRCALPERISRDPLRSVKTSEHPDCSAVTRARDGKFCEVQPAK